MKWKLTYYNESVYTAVSSLPTKLKARYLRMVDMMLNYGPDLGMPHTRSLGEGLLELRIKAKEGIARVFYCTVMNHKMVVLHSIVKKTQKIPNRELELAKVRLKEVKKNA